MSSRRAGTLQPGRRRQRFHLAPLTRDVGDALPGSSLVDARATPPDRSRRRRGTAGGDATVPGGKRFPRVGHEAVLE